MVNAMRAPTLVELKTEGVRPASANGTNFSVTRFSGNPGTRHEFRSDFETIFIAADCTVELAQADRHAVAPARSVAVAPAGRTTIDFKGTGRVFALTSGSAHPAPGSAERGAPPDPRVAAVGTPFVRTGDLWSIDVFAVDELPFPPGNPRLKLLQSATMSINWVEYEGPRDRRKLSPHSHKQFEQGSLAIEGNFVHHIRTPWAEDAGAWRDDLHLPAGASSLLVIPPELIHTTEGVGQERHILIDVFAPVRRDFLAKGWIHNAAAYRDPEPGTAPLV